VGSSSDPIVGVWGKIETSGDATASKKTETCLLLNEDKTHQWLGKSSVTAGGVTTSTDGPCGTGTYVYGNGSLTLTTNYVQYGTDPAAPTKSTNTKTETFQVELLDNSIRLNTSVVYQKMSRPTGAYCP
jgi:hypothetical protein